MANILDLDPFAFAAALEELGLPEEEASRLRQQYRQKQSPLKGVKEAIQPEEARNISNFLPVSVPEGMSIADGVTSGNWDWAIPEALSSGATAAIEGLEAPGQIASGVPYSPQEMQDAAWKTAGVASGVSASSPVPKGSVRMFGGRNAKHFPKDREDQAVEMYWQLDHKGDLAGENPVVQDDIWEKTGIELENGQRAIFQIDPSKAQVADPTALKPSIERFFQKYPDQKEAVYEVKQILDFPELYDNYPDLEDFSVVFDKSLEDNVGGYMNIRDREVVLNTNLLDNPEKLRSVILHEMQHGIQAKELSEGGADSDYFFRVEEDADGGTGLFNKVHSNTKELDKYASEINDKIDYYFLNADRISEEEFQKLAKNIADLRWEAQSLAYKKYLTNEGEIEARAAELWDNLSTEERRTTKPSDVKKQALGLLKKEYGDTHMPTARLYAKGGVVQGNTMQDNMTKLFAEGGVNTGKTEVDPVSGNEVPPGSLPEEVRDDIDAKLSGGEYVVPADVLRFYGVSFFEKLRKKAKEGLAEMDAEGRIGGEDAPEEGMTEAPEEEDDLPFSEDELLFEEDDMGFAEGGIVPPGGIKSFNPQDFYAGFSAFGAAPTQATTGTATTQNSETKTYVNAEGQEIQVTFVNGQPTQSIPAGYLPKGTQTAAKPKSQESWADRQAENPTANNSKTRENADYAPDWGAGKDWKNMSADDAVNLANSRLEGNKFISAGAQILGAISPLAGLAAGAATKLRPFAEANGIEKALRASGNTAAADAVAGIVDKRLTDSKLGIRALEPMLADGSQVAKRLLRSNAVVPTSNRANAVSAVSKSGNSASGKTVGKVTSDSWADRQSEKKDRSKMDTTSKSGSVSFSASGSKKSTGKAQGGLIERRKK